MNKSEFLSALSNIIVTNNWDLPSPGRELNLNEKYHGPDDIVREAIKTEGRRRIESSELESKLIGYGLEAYGHYYLSLESAINQGRKHPATFGEYFPHWLYSAPDHVSYDSLKILEKWFAIPKAIKIKKGTVYWRYRS